MRGGFIQLGFEDEETLIAIKDVAKWLGFENQREYVKALPRLRERIFERAKY